MNKFLALTHIILLTAVTALGQAKRWPRFEDYPATTSFKGRPAPAKIVSSKAKLFRSAIRNGASKGPNFAGHYTLVPWGCGSSCRQFAIVDAQNGTVYIPAGQMVLLTDPWTQNDPLAAEEPVRFRKDSRLLILVGGGYIGKKPQLKGKYFYEWRGNDLRLISSIKRSYY